MNTPFTHAFTNQSMHMHTYAHKKNIRTHKINKKPEYTSACMEERAYTCAQLHAEHKERSRSIIHTQETYIHTYIHTYIYIYT